MVANAPTPGSFGPAFGNAATKNVGTTFGTVADGKVVADHVGDLSNPHSVTKAQIGLSAVDNTPDAGKPVSTAQAAAIAAVGSTVTAVAGNVATLALAVTDLGSKISSLDFNIDSTPTITDDWNM